MPNVRVRVKFDITEMINNLVDDSTAESIGETVVEMAKELISTGQSPIRGEGRFEEYKGVADLRDAKDAARRAEKLKRAAGKTGKNGAAYRKLQADIRERRSAIDAQKARVYPYSVQHKYPDKQVRPVNLYLSGQMLEYLRWERRLDSVRVGFFDAPKDVMDRASGNQFGHDNVPARPMIPQDDEEFSVSIMLELKRIYSERIASIIEDSNR